MTVHEGKICFVSRESRTFRFEGTKQMFPEEAVIKG